MADSNGYWDDFYRSSDRRLSIPSQFATFVANECLEKTDVIVDLGCGNGRDANFFASVGFSVVGVDASDQAIASAERAVEGGAKFIVGSIVDPDLGERIAHCVNTSDSLLVYSRFFLHAINDREEEHFWSLLETLNNPGDMLALEFRTDKDEALEKVTGAHYRRFIRPTALLSRASQKGYECEYFVEGFGLAKYGNDDAHVARFLFRRCEV